MPQEFSGSRFCGTSALSCQTRHARSRSQHFSNRAVAPPATRAAHARFLIQCTQADITGGLGTIISSWGACQGLGQRFTAQVTSLLPPRGLGQPQSAAPASFVPSETPKQTQKSSNKSKLCCFKNKQKNPGSQFFMSTQKITKISQS